MLFKNIYKLEKNVFIMKKSVKFDLSWRAWSLILGFFILIGFVGLSFAYNSGASPSVMGHSASEIEGGAGGTTIVSSCMPNYSAGVPKPLSGFTADKDGFVIINSGETWRNSVTVFMNGKKIANSSGSYTEDSNIITLPMSSGDNVSFSYNSGSSLRNTDGLYSGAATVNFYPCKSSSSGSAGNADYVIESWRATDGSSYYRKYKSGWIEQGGWISSSSSSVIFPTPFVDSCLSFIASKYGAMDPCSYYFGTNQLTNTGAVIIWGGNGWGCGGTVITKFYWEAKGY
jgi:hypothetical protein